MSLSDSGTIKLSDGYLCSCQKIEGSVSSYRHHRVAAPQRGRQREETELTATPAIQLDAQDLIRLFPNSLKNLPLGVIPEGKKC